MSRRYPIAAAPRTIAASRELRGRRIEPRRAAFGVPGQRREHRVERRRQLALHHQAVEEPAEGTEIHPVVERLGDAGPARVAFDPGHPAHEVDGPVALGDLEPERAAVLPVGHPLHDAATWQEVAGTPRADAGPRGALDHGPPDAGVV